MEPKFTLTLWVKYIFYFKTICRTFKDQQIEQKNTWAVAAYLGRQMFLLFQLLPLLRLFLLRGEVLLCFYLRPGTKSKTLR